MDPRGSNALEDGTALPLFPEEAAPSPRRMEPAMDRDQIRRGQLEQEGAVPVTTESHQDGKPRYTDSGTTRNAPDEVRRKVDNTRGGSVKQRGHGEDRGR